MADYSVDIKIAVAGSRELKAARKETTALTREINTLNKLANKQSKTLPNSFNTLNKVLGQAKGNLNKVALGTDRYFRAISDVIDKEERLSKAYKKQKTDFKVIERLRRKGLDINKQNIQQIRNELAAEIKLERAKRRTGKASISKGMAGKLGGTASSAIIGGSFPLLFGQTGAAAVGGGLGGAAGGLIGGQFGFALSILGTAIGSAIDKNEKFRKSLASLNVQFTDTSGGTQILAADVDRLAKRLGVTKDEAIAALSAFKEFGSSSVAKSLVSIFGTDSGGFDTLAATNRQAALANQIFESRKQIGNEVAKQLLQQNLINDSATIELALAEAKAKAANEEAIAKAKVVTFTDLALAAVSTGPGNVVDPKIFGEERAQKIQEEFDKNRLKRIEDLKNSLKEVRELLGLVNEANGQFGQSGVLAFSAINDKVKDLQDEMKALQNPIRMAITLSDTMATSFEDSFKGIIRGTMTVADAFRNMLNKIADHFIDTAARMMANQFQQGILGLFGNLFSGFNAPAPMVAAPGTFGTNIPSGVQAPGMFNITPKADGGPVKAGGSYIVGERGPEMFSPGVSGMITPNHALGGGTTVIVNVDASGSSVEGDEQQGRELGRLISVAVQSELVQQKRPGGLLA